jgi:hypothetical protein
VLAVLRKLNVIIVTYDHLEYYHVLENLRREEIPFGIVADEEEGHNGREKE